MTRLRTSDRDVTLPPYMTSLSQSVLDVFANFPDAQDRVIAAGVSEGQLYMLDCLLNIKMISPSGRLVPEEACPSHDGTFIHVKFLNEDKHEIISSKLALMRGASILNKSSLYVNDRYVCGLDVEELETIGLSDVHASEEIHK